MESDISSSQIPLRLKKYLSSFTALSNKMIKELYDSGNVTVISKQKKEPEENELVRLIYPQEDVVMVHGKEILPIPPEKVHIALYKPAGYECTSISADMVKHSDGLIQNVQSTGLEKWLKKFPPGVAHVGRLDKDTTGLLILTNDHDLNYNIRKIENTVIKEYHVDVAEDLDIGDPRLQLLLQEMELKDGPAKALGVGILQKLNPGTKISLEICEGRNHIVKRMIKTAGLHLLHLHRSRVGPVTLSGLPEPGDFRHLTAEEIEALWTACGGREMVLQYQMAALWKHVQECRKGSRPNVRLEAWLRDHFPGQFEETFHF